MKKKKMLVLLLTIGAFATANAQQTVILQNQQISSNPIQSEAYYINGIPSSQDIGGVEVSRSNWNSTASKIRFENYNNFPVSVIFEVTTGGNENIKQTGTIVLQGNEKKDTRDYYDAPCNFKLISRRLDTQSSNNASSSINQSEKIITLAGYLRVYPEDLGKFEEYPASIVASMNRNKAYGISTWRLPTENELRILFNNQEKIGLGDPWSIGGYNGYGYWYLEKGNYPEKSGPWSSQRIRLVSHIAVVVDQTH